jgi:cellulose synthase/poly-beta-1,6-N-acetylglucosamine synthase-like glycosyltransferase
MVHLVEGETSKMSVYMLLLLGFFLYTIVNVVFLPNLTDGGDRENSPAPLVSLLVPMRNEERNVEGLMCSIKRLTYPNLELLFLDDQSTDSTGQMLQQYAREDHRISVLRGRELPAGWVGKVHACYQLSQEAKGDYLLFIDADVRLKSDTVERTLQLQQKSGAGLLTGFPKFPVKTWLEKLLVPMQHVLVFFHLPVALANGTTWKAATAAHGAFMFFDRKAYETSGGHEAVKASLIEDVHLAQTVKQNGIRVLLVNITSHVTCFMYETNREVWNGFAKNIYTGLGRSPVRVLMLTGYYLIFYIYPLPLFAVGLAAGHPAWLWPLAIVWGQRLLVDWHVRQQKHLAWLMPVSALALVVIMNYSMLAALLKWGYEWKGRQYQ